MFLTIRPTQVKKWKVSFHDDRNSVKILDMECSLCPLFNLEALLSSSFENLPISIGSHNHSEEGYLTELTSQNEEQKRTWRIVAMDYIVQLPVSHLVQTKET
jgi:hypothetical protein